jgi:NAD+ kinase
MLTVMSDPTVTIGLIAHAGKEGAEPLVRAVTEELKKRGATYLMEKMTASLIGESSPLDEAALAQHCGLLLVMGGDGSILRALHRSAGHIRPIFGINIGSLGFLTCLGSDDYMRAVDSVIEGSYVLSTRSLLDVSITGPEKNFPLERALNDVTISRGERSQLVKLQASIDGLPLTEYHADGLIVATPTGSTAYSLAAGGPILMPDSGALVITPICPHVLSNRSLVISDKSEVVISAVGNHEVFVTVDGRTPHALKPGQRVALRLSPQSLPLAMMPESTFPEVLRQKLKWTGSNI